MTETVSMGPYTEIEAVFAVDADILDEYEKAGEEFGAYRALAQAPPSYLKQRFVWVYMFILGAIVTITILIGIFWTRRLARRIHRLSEATALVAQGDLSIRVNPGADDEVGSLVESFNGMVADLEMSRSRIVYLQKISAWQDVARRLAHEIKNPLTPIQLAAQQLREKYSGGDAAFRGLLEQSTEIIEEEVATLRRLTSDFSSFAKLPEVRPELTNLSDFLSECEASLAHISEPEGVALTFNIPTKPVLVLFDRIMMKRVFDNLVRNAAEALRESNAPNREISVSARQQSAKRRQEVEIRVEDNGPGIRPEHHPSIFEPYYTTKSEGTGLGLAITKKIVLEHGGQIWVEDRPSGGAAFVIVVPLASRDRKK
jgi:nitrogen fixation/metabolism regulation signal transduction histidine kinase